MKQVPVSSHEVQRVCGACGGCGHAGMCILWRVTACGCVELVGRVRVGHSLGTFAAVKELSSCRRVSKWGLVCARHPEMLISLLSTCSDSEAVVWCGCGCGCVCGCVGGWGGFWLYGERGAELQGPPTTFPLLCAFRSDGGLARAHPTIRIAMLYRPVAIAISAGCMRGLMGDEHSLRRPCRTQSPQRHHAAATRAPTRVPCAVCRVSSRAVQQASANSVQTAQCVRWKRRGDTEVLGQTERSGRKRRVGGEERERQRVSLHSAHPPHVCQRLKACDLHVTCSRASRLSSRLRSRLLWLGS